MKNFLVFIAVVATIIGAICIYTGFDKINNYYMSEYGYSTNAYVGGDAYNYIINGTYFTGYSVIGIGCFLIAIISIGSVAIIKAIEEKSVHIE